MKRFQDLLQQMEADYQKIIRDADVLQGQRDSLSCQLKDRPVPDIIQIQQERDIHLRTKQEIQEQKIKSMKDVFYKEDFKVYIFEDEDLDNESLIAAVESSPTHKRLAKELQLLKSHSAMAKAEEEAAENVTEEENNN